MKLCAKKIYCPSCQRLVRCQEQPINSKTNIVCSRCENPIWIKDGISWRYATTRRKNEVGRGQAEGAPKLQQKIVKEVLL